MMKLRTAPHSPSGRKVVIAADLLGLLGDIEIVLTDTKNPEDPLRKDNPLGKIPTLVSEDGFAIYDSRMIIDYLDRRAGGGKLIPVDPDLRSKALVREVLADGINDAAILIVYEGRYRPADKRVESWVETQQGKITRGLDHLEETLTPISGPIDIGQVAVACALGYQDMRFDGRWRNAYPKLVAWLADFEERVPMFAKTWVAP